MERSVKVEVISSGQPRPYADSIYESYLTFSVPEGQMWASKFGHTEEVAKDYVKLFVRDFYEGDEKGSWWRNRLEKLEQVSPGRWHVIIRAPYLD